MKLLDLQSKIQAVNGEDLTDKLINLSPWLTPLSGMQITIQNMLGPLNYWPPVAYLTGVAIEILGVATLSTALDFYQHNKRYADDKNKMPLIVPGLAFGFYIVLIMAIVILLEIPLEGSQKVASLITVKAMLTLLSIPAGLIIAVRKLHKDTLQKLSKKKQTAAQVSEGEAVIAPAPAQVSPQVSEPQAQVSETFENWKRVPENIRKEIALLSHWSEVQKRFPNLIEKTAQNWLKSAKALYPNIDKV